ncbi:MAG TPA: nuclear transport factor 2 family protein [Candidatus Acidoferrum sp.]|jgi:ketosteroid isomerase-like protein
MSTQTANVRRVAGLRYHWIIYVVLAFFGGLLTFVGAMAEQKATDDATFRKLTDDYCAAWSSGNPANAAKFYTKTDGSIFYDITPFSYSSWKDYQTGVQKAFFDSAVSATLTAGKELKVTRHGNIAWTTVPMHLSEKTKDAKDVELNVRYTGIWEKHGKTWLLVHEHLSVPLS